MAKYRKSYGRSAGCPEPINTLIDIAGAAVMGAVTKHRIMKDYKRGKGEASVKAAMLVHGSGAMRRGSDGIVSLGGVYGINSALREIERQESKPTAHHYDAVPDIPAAPVSVNNNRYAWRLNCEDGSEYGVSPYDYETRAEYNAALNRVRFGTPEKTHHAEDTAKIEAKPAAKVSMDIYRLCRVSRLDNGQNAYYLTGEKHPIGSQVKIPTDGGFSVGVVLSYEEHTVQTLPVPLDMLQRIIEDE